MSELVRIRKIFTKTGGDWYVIELEDGRRFEIGSPTRRAEWTVLNRQLESSDIRPNVRQSTSPGSERHLWIDDIVESSSPGFYDAIREGKPVFSIDSNDAKTLLYDTSP